MGIREDIKNALDKFDGDWDEAYEYLEAEGDLLFFDDEEPDDAIDYLLPGKAGITPTFEYLWSSEHGVLILKEIPQEIYSKKRR